MRGISLPVMSQPHKFVASLAPTPLKPVSQLTRQQAYLNLDWLDHMWWSDDVDREIQTRTNRGSEREIERRGESENFWIVAIRCLTTCAIQLRIMYGVGVLYMPQIFTLYTLLYIPLSTTYPNHYRSTDRLSSYIGPPIIFLIFALPSSHPRPR